MGLDKFKAFWNSHSSISAFKNCPLGYYYGNIYKDKDKKKISTVSPHLTLGCAVHAPLEALAEIPSEERKNTKFAPAFFKTWEEFDGEKGGFKDAEEEESYKLRGIEMLKNVKENIHHLEGETAFLIPDKNDLPWFWLSEEENLILAGKLDFLLKKEDCYYVIDFKSGMKDEHSDSLQLPIYRLLLNHFLGESDFKAAYWNIGRDKSPIEKKIPSLEESRELVLDVARKMKQARLDNKFECPRGENFCFACRDYQKIISGDAKFVGYGTYGAKLYSINS